MIPNGGNGLYSHPIRTIPRVHRSIVDQEIQSLLSNNSPDFIRRLLTPNAISDVELDEDDAAGMSLDEVVELCTPPPCAGEDVCDF